LDEAALAAGRHAKAVELLGTLLARFRGGNARSHRDLQDLPRERGTADVEYKVSRVLAAVQAALPAEAQDILALATAFRDPPAEGRLLDYLASAPVRSLLHEHWGRIYTPFVDRPTGWLASQVQDLVALRLLERVGAPDRVIDAHPLVRRAFERARGPEGARQSAGARAGFLRGRPDRRRSQTLAEAREDIELFHAFCEAGLWNEADSAFVALDNPKHRFLAPALERDLLLRFFPGGDWRRPPLWPGFGRYRSLAIALEMLGRFEDAIEAYRQPDAPLRGDALLALGRLGPLLEQPQAPHPWQTLWGAYRCHALALAGRADEALAAAQGLVPVDVYEWAHVFECLLRLGRLDVVDLRSLLFRPPGGEHRWADLARRRMRADYLRVRQQEEDLQREYRDLLKEYDRAGLPLERVQTRLSYGRLLLAHADPATAEVANDALQLARRHGLHIVEADALDLLGAVADGRGDAARAAAGEADELRRMIGYFGSSRP
jgi:hypothetical protein